MNKTESVSIGRRGFVCEQDAYKLLQEYLERSEKALQDDPDKQEILADLEVSMAGHLEELAGTLVVDAATAQKVIDQMGEVNASESEAANKADSDKKEQKDFGDRVEGRLKNLFKKPLYKDHTHQIGDGVCAGIANALDVDAIWVRIVFVVLTFLTQGFMLLVYVILDIIMKDEEGYHKRTAGEVVQDVREKIVDSVSVRNYESTLRKVVVGFFATIWWIFKIIAIISLASVVIAIGAAWGFLLFATLGNTQLAADVLGQITWLKMLAVGLAGVVLILPFVHVLALLISPKKILTNARLGAIIWVTWFIALFGAAGAIGNTLPEIVHKWRESPPHTRFVNVRTADGEIKSVCGDFMGGCLEPKHYIYGYTSPCSTNINQYVKGEADYWIGKLSYTKKDVIRIPYPGTMDQLCASEVELAKKYGADNIVFSEDFENEDVVTVSMQENGQAVQKKYWQVEYIYNDTRPSKVE